MSAIRHAQHGQNHECPRAAIDRPSSAVTTKPTNQCRFNRFHYKQAYVESPLSFQEFLQLAIFSNFEGGLSVSNGALVVKHVAMFRFS